MILGATITGSLTLNGVNLASITGSEASINALNSFTASAATTGSNVFKSNQTVTGSLDITGSLTVVGPITGTVTTASYVLNAVSASYALNATTSSFALVATSASYALASTSASYALASTSASYALIATSASYALVSTSASYAANSDLLDGRDSLTFANTGSNSFVGTQNINGSVAITGSLTTTGAITAQTLNVQQVTSSIVYSSGSNIFGNSVSNTQSMTGSVGISGSLSVNGVSTLSGALSGTSATFSGALLVNNNDITQNGTRPILSLQQSGTTKAFWGISSGASDLVVGDSSGDAVFRKPASSGAFRWSVDGGSTSAFVLASTGAATFSSSITATSGAFSGGVTVTSASTTGVVVNSTSGASFRGYVIQSSGTSVAGMECDGNTGQIKIGGYQTTGDYFPVIYSDGVASLTFGLGASPSATFSGNVSIAKTTPLLVLNDTSGSSAQIGSFGGNLNLIDNATGTKGLVISLSTGAATFSSSGLFGGELSVGGSLSADRMFQVSGTAFTSGATQFGIVNNPTMTTPTTIYGYYGGITVTSATTAYGLYLTSASGTITTKYGIYQEGSADKNYFAGNVGIGTTSPTGQLSLANQISNGSNPVASYAATSAVNGQNFLNGYYANNTDGYGTYPRYLDIVSVGQPDGTNGGSNIRFLTNPIANNSPAVERMRITSGGTVLIAKTSSDVTVSGCELSSTGAVFTRNDDALLVNRQGSDGAAITIRRSNVTVGTISVTSSATAYNTSSDYRLKEDLQEIKGLERVQAIKVYDFKWKSEDSRMDGVIAHELAEVLPYAVHGEKDAEEMQGVDYSKIVPIMIKAIQEQQAQIESQQAQITELQNK